MRKNTRVIIFISGVLLLAFGMLGLKEDDKRFQISKGLDIFATLFRDVNLFYVDDVQPEKMVQDGIDYLQEYADVFHHQKEEELVFSRLKQASPQGKLLVEQGMLVEHDLARYYIRSMKKLLKKDVTEEVCVRLIGFIQAYIDLLERHIEKENSVAYPYAVRKLAMDEIQKAFDAHGEYERMEELREFLKLS